MSLHNEHKPVSSRVWADVNVPQLSQSYAPLNSGLCYVLTEGASACVQKAAHSLESEIIRAWGKNANEIYKML